MCDFLDTDIDFDGDGDIDFEDTILEDMLYNDVLDDEDSDD